LNLKSFGSLKILVENSLKICVFSAIKAKYFMYLKKEPISNER
jgi:hypothetical protein